jgi:hypothetical protein
MHLKLWYGVIVVLAAAATFFITSKLRSRDDRIQETALPADLNTRAELFTKAWLQSDWSQMRRLVRPGMDKAVYSWWVHNPPPEDLADEYGANQVRVEAIKEQVQSHQAELTVYFRGSGLQVPEFQQWWEEVGGNWYFVVPE